MVLLDTRPTCQVRLEGGPLVCTREPGHAPGHTYRASDAPDRHSEPQEEALH